ncbi:MAG TPA: 50S ribosomal protein L3 N(5)-glutamine methyltransferase [Burkholderiales bacterium]|nr:50S ribosomal protein L3 N(5)-glutamine methyltransferase [Burkholderiales bacterium]
MTTLGELIAATEKRFRAARLHYGHGTDNPRDEAAFLALRSLRLPFETSLEKAIAPKAVRHVELLARRRIAERKPAAYLLKEAWLDGVKFYVDERVIIPRSHIAFLLKGLPQPKRVLDLCTGSGCLAALAARAFPRAEVVASDLSPDALAVARKNVGRRVRLVESDLFEKLRDERFDLILANPPYVDAPAMRALPREYRHEPRLALAAGKDGLVVVDRILREAKEHLTPRGLLLCEVGDSRRALERRHPGLRFAWPHAAVFRLRREEMG